MQSKNNNNEGLKPVGRRDFLLMAAGAGLSLVIPAAALAGGEKWVAVGKSAQFTLNEPRQIVLPSNAGTIIITRTERTKLTAVSAICTHKGCIVAYAAAEKDLLCPCHGATFTIDGKNTKGTRKHPDEKLPSLAVVPVKEVKGQVMVDLTGVATATKDLPVPKEKKEAPAPTPAPAPGV